MARVPLRPTRRKDDFESLWLITFADLMVQLMAFFAVIYAFSAQDQQKLQQVLQSFQHELGVKGAGILPGNLGLDPTRACSGTSPPPAGSCAFPKTPARSCSPRWRPSRRPSAAAGARTA